jgi:hypothetical protein
MKTNDKQANDLKTQLKEDKHQVLAHILSPIELEALSRNYYRFNYKLNDVEISISSAICKRLKEISLLKISLFTSVFDKTILQQIGKTAELRLFLDIPIDQHNLSTRLEHSLKGLDCYTLFQVIELGRKRVSRSRGIGKAGIEQIDALLKKHSCEFLFS